MKILKNPGLVYFLIPFIVSPILSNKVGLALSVLFGKKEHKIKLNDGSNISFKSSEYNTMQSFLGVITYAITYRIDNDQTLEVSFDDNNVFHVNLKNMSNTDRNLLDIIFLAIRSGADLISENNDSNQRYREKTLKIINKNNKKIIETYNGIRFYLDSINPGTIVECYINNVHMLKSNESFTGKIIIDVGAERGDTPLYFAQKGATVYAFEPIKENFDDMIKNISLNPNIEKNIIPINAAIGKDEILKFYQSPDTPNVGSSFAINRHGKNAKIQQVQGYTIASALKKFKIDHVDLLKMDCKGCEFFLTEKDLELVDKIKIEYMDEQNPRKFKDLIKLLEKMKFGYIIYRISPFDRMSNKIFGHIFGEKK